MDLPAPLLVVLHRTVKHLHLICLYINAHYQQRLFMTNGNEEAAVQSGINREELDIRHAPAPSLPGFPLFLRAQEL